jgi:prophage tail gpP-like protein
VLPDLHPSIANTRVVITTRWGNSAYRPVTVRNIESYYVDTALDNDADTWTVDVGDPNGDLLDLLGRDSEIRAQLFGVGQEGIDFLITGIADDAQYEDGTWTLTGRDYSSLATDSTVRPSQFRHVRAWSIVAEQAKFLGFTKTSLSRAGMVKKVQYTDGSESYWDFWYRLYRKEKMWIWCEPNGLLVAGRLNYNQSPTYYLGDPLDDDPDYIIRQSIPVIGAVMRKSTQARVYEVLVYGHKGDNGFSTTARDGTMAAWVRKPRKVMLDTESHTIKGAQKTGWEEIFEGKVGSKEYRITIADPGFAIKQNRIARLHLSDIGLLGNFFVVGSRVQASSDGFVQEIRLREKQYAVTRRVPSDPKLITNDPKDKAVISSLGAAVEQANGQIPIGWGDYYVKAAKQFHGKMDFNLFLATLIAISDQETGGSFKNERQNGGPGGDHIDWYPYDGSSLGVKGDTGKGVVTGQGESRSDYEEKFANEIGGQFNLSMEFGVGPMQLTSRGLKNEADDRLRQNFRNQYEGGRWHPEYNIWIGAKNLAACVDGVNAIRDIDMWLAADAYNRGIAGALSYFAANGHISPYGISVKSKVYNDPGYLTTVKGAVQAAQEAAKAARDGETDISGSSSALISNVTPQQILRFFNSYNATKASPVDRRNAIALCAMWGFYHADEIHYSNGAFRMKDFAPPPNVPENTDCSGFVTWCYRVAGVLDPNGNNYNGLGFTGSLWDTGQHISIVQLRIGDLVFYGDPHSFNSHVTVFIGNGQVISMGSEPGPFVLPIRYRADISGFATYNV